MSIDREPPGRDETLPEHGQPCTHRTQCENGRCLLVCARALREQLTRTLGCTTWYRQEHLVVPREEGDA